MAHKGLMWELETASHTDNERIVSQLTKCFGLPIDEDLLKSLIELALEREYIDFLVLLVDKAIPHEAENVLNNSLFYYISNIHDKEIMDYILNTLINLSGIEESDTENFELLQLLIGIIRNDDKSFKRFKKMNIDINKSIVAKSSTLNGYAPLHIAVLCENHIFTETLLYFGSKTSVKDAGGLSPIHHGLQIKNAKVNGMLCSAFMVHYDPVDDHGISPLHIACMIGSMSRAKRYLKKFLDVDRQIMYHNTDYDGCTPLHLAVTEGFVPLVKLLLNYGADVSMMNAEEMSPLHLALFLQKYDIVDLLLTDHIGNFNNPVDSRGVSHFHIACNRGNIAVAEMFIRNGIALDDQVFATSLDWPLYSALHFAVLSSCTPIIKHLLSKGANPNCQDSEGFTPLNLACFEGLEESVKVLLELKVDLNIQSKRESTPLQTAIMRGHYKIVKRFVEGGVNINSRDNGNETPPLITAILYKRYQIMEYLLKNGANVAVKQRDGKTALHILALLEHPQDRSSYNKLCNHIARFRKIDYSSFDLECYQDDIDNYFIHVVVERLITKGCDINARDNMQCTPLHLACQDRRTVLVTLLLQYGADINAVDNKNLVALQYTNSYEVIDKRFTKHIQKLKYVGYPLNSYNERFLEERERRGSRLYPWFKVSCDNELDRMKNEIIDNYSSLYDFLIKNPDYLLDYMNNSILIDYVFHHDFRKMYPAFGALIQANFRTAKKRARLFMLAKISMKFFTKVPLPDACTINIFRYLNDEDVKPLILALQ